HIRNVQWLGVSQPLGCASIPTRRYQAKLLRFGMNMLVSRRGPESVKPAKPIRKFGPRYAAASSPGFFRVRLKSLFLTLLVHLLVPAGFAHDESEIDVGRTGAGLLKVVVQSEQPLVLHPSPFPGMPGYATAALGLHSIFVDDPTNDLFAP